MLPGAPLVTGGPDPSHYTHPNYVGIFGEFAGSAVMLNAPVTGVVVALSFFYFLRKRIAVEERALGIGATHWHQSLASGDSRQRRLV